MRYKRYGKVRMVTKIIKPGIVSPLVKINLYYARFQIVYPPKGTLIQKMNFAKLFIPSIIDSG